MFHKFDPFLKVIYYKMGENFLYMILMTVSYSQDKNHFYYAYLRLVAEKAGELGVEGGVEDQAAALLPHKQVNAHP